MFEISDHHMCPAVNGHAPTAYCIQWRACPRSTAPATTQRFGADRISTWLRDSLKGPPEGREQLAPHRSLDAGTSGRFRISTRSRSKCRRKGSLTEESCTRVRRRRPQPLARDTTEAPMVSRYSRAAVVRGFVGETDFLSD